MPFDWQYISSKSNALVVRLSKLKDKKYRRAERLFRFDGIKLFCEAVQKGAPVKYVLLRESAADRLKDIAERELSRFGTDTLLYILGDDAFDRLTDEQAPEGIITVCAELEHVLEGHASDITGNRVLMLESVRDAGNMGTIIRSAVAFGIDTLVISSDCADLYNSKTVRAAMGALFKQRIVIVDSIPDTVNELRACGRHVFAAALSGDAKTLGSFTLERGDVILIGNEGHGLSDEAIEACDARLYIPMEADAESLNAGIAASICMWELYKTK